MPDLNQQSTYNDQLIKGATDFAKTLPSTGVGRFSNIPATVRSSNIPATTPSSLKNLGKISTNYGESTRFEKFHPALDIANAEGTNISSFSSGVVSSVQTPQQSGGFGNSLIITDDQNRQWRYSHLSQSYVRTGERVNQGSTIGSMGNTGNVYSTTGGSGSHLDLRIFDTAKKYYLNPLSVIS